MRTSRVIHMNARHAHPAITSWLGDAIGRLVSPATTVTERFTRISHEEMNYRFTIDDPNWYERPWTGETHFTRSDQRLLEAACHEGNYSMRFNLEAARSLEAGL